MEETKAQVPHKRRNRIVLTLTLIAALLVAGLFCTWFFMNRDTGPIPRKYTKGLGFTLYYPTRLPQGYSVNMSSFKREGNVLIFSINAPSGRNVAVAQQATPADLPAQSDKPLPVPLPNEKSFQSSIGAAHIALWGDKFVSDVTTTKGTWIILNVSGFTMDEATSITQSFAEL